METNQHTQSTKSAWVTPWRSMIMGFLAVISAGTVTAAPLARYDAPEFSGETRNFLQKKLNARDGITLRSTFVSGMYAGMKGGEIFFLTDAKGDLTYNTAGPGIWAKSGRPISEVELISLRKSWLTHLPRASLPLASNNAPPTMVLTTSLSCPKCKRLETDLDTNKTTSYYIAPTWWGDDKLYQHTYRGICTNDPAKSWVIAMIKRTVDDPIPNCHFAKDLYMDIEVMLTSPLKGNVRTTPAAVFADGTVAHGTPAILDALKKYKGVGI